MPKTFPRYVASTGLLVLVAGSTVAQTTDWVSRANTLATTIASATAPRTASATAVKATRSQSSFITSAMQSNLAEIAAGQSALTRSHNADVKAFAQRMIDDHTAANSKLAALAGTLSVAAPTSPGYAAQAKAKLMNALNGAAFDRVYLRNQVDSHKDAVKLYQKQAGVAADGEVTTYAKATLPTLQQHLTEARTLETKIKTAN